MTTTTKTTTIENLGVAPEDSAHGPSGATGAGGAADRRAGRPSGPCGACRRRDRDAGVESRPSARGISPRDHATRGIRNRTNLARLLPRQAARRRGRAVQGVGLGRRRRHGRVRGVGDRGVEDGAAVGAARRGPLPLVLRGARQPRVCRLARDARRRKGWQAPGARLYNKGGGKGGRGWGRTRSRPRHGFLAAGLASASPSSRGGPGLWRFSAGAVTAARSDEATAFTSRAASGARLLGDGADEAAGWAASMTLSASLCCLASRRVLVRRERADAMPCGRALDRKRDSVSLSVKRLEQGGNGAMHASSSKQRGGGGGEEG